MNLYNDIEPFVCEWTENLIAAGEIPAGRVDRRPIQELTAKDVNGCTQCHFFSGVGGWPYALCLAGWPVDRPVWTASLPCQPFSGAGKQRGHTDVRHLWPYFYALVCECRPDVIVGEQTPEAVRLGWVDGLRTDLERAGYAFGFAVLPTACVQSPHQRHRIYWMAIAAGNGHSNRVDRNEVGSRQETQGGGELAGRRIARVGCNGDSGRMADSRHELRPRPGQGAGLDAPERLQQGIDADEGGVLCGLGNAERQGRSGHSGDENQQLPAAHGSRAAPGVRMHRMCPVCCSAAIRGGAAIRGAVCAGCLAIGMGHTYRSGSGGRSETESERSLLGSARDWSWAAGFGPWSDFRIVNCLDGKARRVGRGVAPLAHGLPRSLGPGSARSDRVRLLAAKANRVGRIRGYGNTICPQVAAGFVQTVMDILEGNENLPGEMHPGRLLADGGVPTLAGWSTPRSSEIGRRRSQEAIAKARLKGGSVSLEDQVQLVIEGDAP